MKIIELEKNDEIYITNKDGSRSFHIKCVKNKLTYEEIENFKAEENTIIKNINFDELTMFVNTFNLTANVPNDTKRKKIFNELEDIAFDNLYGNDYGSLSPKIKNIRYQAIFQLYTNEEIEKENKAYEKLLAKNKEEISKN